LKKLSLFSVFTTGQEKVIMMAAEDYCSRK